jgi:hypothetical protein
VHKVKKYLPLGGTKSQPRHPLGLSYWQEQKLKKLRAEEAKKKTLRRKGCESVVERATRK